MNAGEAPALPRDQVQRLVAGCDLDRGRHVVLEVHDAAAARRLLRELLARGRITFADSDHRYTERDGAVNVGFTYQGLDRLGVAGGLLGALRERAPAFHEGAARRAASRLGDAGISAARRWDTMFAAARADLVLTIRADSAADVARIADDLEQADTAKTLRGWHDGAVDTAHLTQHRDAAGRKVRMVHFGFRDDIARPRIVGLSRPPVRDLHAAGELLLGYDNDAGFDRWSETAALAAFFRHGSFVVLRRIEQDEAALRRYLDEQVRRLAPMHWHVDGDYVKAKMCGRWPNGARVEPGQTRQPGGLDVGDGFDFGDDPAGHGCPFGAHIRRTNPRADAVVPPRGRVLFRRGMPYGPPHDDGEPDGVERGLLGVFCVASIDDQFEHVMGQWVEHNPIGVPNLGRAKDPLIGHHDDPGAAFHVPLRGSPGLWLDDFTPFVRTRGTLYTLFPSRDALETIAGAGSGRSSATPRAGAMHAAPAPSAAPAAGDIATHARFCDLVMEGGVTSGIVYARAVHELAKAYRFHAIGGTSVGAFAATLTAAAEFRRRQAQGDGPAGDAGFEQLNGLVTLLGEQDDQSRTLLERLFQPQRETRRLFAIVHAALGRRSKASALVAAVRRAFAEYRWHALAWLAGFVLLAAAGPLSLACWGDCSVLTAARPIGAEAWLPPLLLTLMAGVVVAAVFGVLAGIVGDLLRGLVGNGFGLCRGWSKGAEPLTTDLTGFMHATIQRVAGRDAHGGAPLTFEDLWGAAGGPPVAAGREHLAHRSIDLQLYATNLSHGRPYRFPFDAADDDMGRLYFRPDDIEHYFPPPVVRHLRAWSRPFEQRTRHDPPAGPAWAGYWELPAGKLPLVVAARISMSFPLLLSAVPLYTIDYEVHAREARKPRRSWMSDGGLCTNFPIHLFDALVPRWPTFGISLQRRPHGDARRVWLPDRHYEGRGDSGLDDLDAGSRGSRLLAFVVGLWRAGSGWSDMALLRMPAVRDRVVRVLLDEGEGGVNIRMKPSEIRRLGEYGVEAAKALIDKFASPGSAGWAEHRWVRLNRLVAALRHEVQGFRDTTRAHGGAPALADQVAQSLAEAPLRGPQHVGSHPDPSERPLDWAQWLELRLALQALTDLEASWPRAGDPPPYRALPRAQLRVRPPA